MSILLFASYRRIATRKFLDKNKKYTMFYTGYVMATCFLNVINVLFDFYMNKSIFLENVLQFYVIFNKSLRFGTGGAIFCVIYVIYDTMKYSQR